MGQTLPCMRQVWVKADIILHMALGSMTGRRRMLGVNEKVRRGHRTRRARGCNISGRKSGICLIKAMRQEGLRLLWGCLPAIITTRMTLIMKPITCVGARITWPNLTLMD